MVQEPVGYKCEEEGGGEGGGYSDVQLVCSTLIYSALRLGTGFCGVWRKIKFNPAKGRGFTRLP